MKISIAVILLGLILIDGAWTVADEIKISDIPRHTQMSSFPAPEGAPGMGRYSPPLPSNPNLPTLWIIGDSTVRNGTLGEGPDTAQWGWGAADRCLFRSRKIERRQSGIWRDQ